MNIGQFVADLENLGVHLWEDAGQLRFRAPGGVLTDARRDLLREHKPAVLAHLRRLAETQALAPDAAARHEPFPLTDVQSSYLLGRSDAYPCGGVACTAYLEIRFGPFDPGLAERAWRQLIHRHDALRTVFHADGYQRVLPQVPDYRIAVTDLRGGAAGAVDEAVLATREEMVPREFTPGQWPLFDLRATRSDAHTLLHLSVDMLIGDYASVHLLVAELDQLCRDPDRRLAPLTVGFRDYVLAERASDHSGRRQRDRDYWRSRLGDVSPETPEALEASETPEVPEAPALPPRPGLPTVDGTSPLRRFRRVQTRLSEQELTDLRNRAGAHGVTTSGALLAAYAETIARWSGQRRFTLNLPLFNRLPLHPQVDRLVGDFTSVTLLAVDHAAPDSFAARATAIQAQLWRDMDHRLCSGVEVLRELARRRGRDASLMPVVFTSTLGLPDADVGPDRPGARHGEIVFGCSRTPQVWIDCQVMEDRGALVVGWDVREGVLPPGLADDAFWTFCSLVRNLAGSDAAWERPAGEPLPPAQLATRLRVNNTAAPLPDRLLHEDIVAQARSTPDRIAVVDPTRTLTYREVLTEANAVAAELRAIGSSAGDSAGDLAGTVVAVLMDKGWEQVVAVLGVLLAGAAYLPIDTAGPPSRTDAMLTDAGVRTVLTQPWTVADLPGRDIVRVRAGGPAGTGAPLPDTPASTGRPDDLAYVIYTSGSTGRPKGVMISHRAAGNTIEDINRRFGVDSDDRVLGLSSLSFDLSVYDIVGPLSRGGCLVLPTGQRRQDASYWAELIDRHGVTVWNSVPAQMQMLRYYLDSERSVGLSSLRLALLSGDRIPTGLARHVTARLPGVRLVSLGGATEASIWSIVHPIGHDADGRTTIPYGTPLTNQSFHVLDAELRDCPDWTTGELHIGGAGLAIGYLGDERMTARRFIRHPVTGRRLYRTGDVGRYRDDGVIEILGRVDDQVKIRGHRVELAEVEAALGSHPAVAAAVALADGDRLVSFVVPGPRPHLAPGRMPEQPPSREADRADDAGVIATAAGAAGATATADIDGALLATFLERADDAALDAITCTLRAAGLFAVRTTAHGLDEIAAALGADPRHRRVLRRWMSALTGAGRLLREASGRYRGLDTVEPAALARRWDELEGIERKLGYGTDLLALIRTSSDHLAELLRGERDPLDLLFPQGTWRVAEGVYRDNLVSRCLNQAVVAGLRAIAERAGDRPLRVLEVGAGVGGTSTVLVPALAEFSVDYLFTDVSPFFTTQAAQRLGRYPWVRYGLFDINADARAQGLLPNSFDVLVCQNVLHNARDAAVVLDRLRELLAPGGWLVIVETTVERHPLLVSMDFVDGLAAGFDDVRKDADRTFLTRDQWLDLLTAAGAETALCYPEPHEALSLAGQHVFLARVKSDRAPVTSAELVEHAATRLSEHMVPGQVQVLDALPLTPNAKVDRGLLRTWLPARVEPQPGAAPTDEPRDDLERRIAEVWTRVLDCPRVGRNDNFFALGGDSLLVARLVGQLREREPRAAGVDWESMLRQMLLSPTVAGLAAFLRPALPARDVADTGGHADGKEGADAHPAPVTFTRAGTGPVRVLVHDGSGTLLPYQALLDEIARRPAAGPVLGVEAGPVDRYLQVDPAVLIERLAASHTRSLIAGGDDRFHVVGYCMGGLIAAELARMLTESGARVESLTVISCYRPSFLVEEELVAEYAFALSLGVPPARLGYPSDDALFGRAIDAVLAETPDRIPAGRIAALADNPDRGPHGDLTGIGRCFRDLADRPQPDRLTAMALAMPNSASAPCPEELTRLYRVFRHSLSAVTRHRTEPYAGGVTFLRHSGRYGFLPGLREDMGNYWREVCLGDLSVVDIPGDHFTCLSQPYAAGVYDLFPGGDR